MKNFFYGLLLGLILGAVAGAWWQGAEFVGVANGRDDLSVQGKTARQWYRQLEDRNPMFRRDAVAALGEIGTQDQAVLPTLLEKVDDEDAGVRTQIVRVLSRLAPRDEAVLAALIKCLKDVNRLVRMQAVVELGKDPLPEKHIIAAFISTLEDPDAYIRLGAIKGLSRLGPAATAAVPALKAIIAGDDPGLGRHAEEALASIAPGA